MPSQTLLSDLAKHMPPQARIATMLHVAGSPLWALQAWGIAVVIGGWLAQQDTHWWAIMLVAMAGTLRAGTQHWARGALFDAAQHSLAPLRERLINDVLRRLDPPQSSAAFAALLVEKLPLLMPYLTRYRPARLRAVIGPVILLVLVFSMSWAVGLVLLIAIPLIPMFMALIGYAARDASARQLQEVSSLNTLLADRLAAAVDLRLLAAKGRAVEDFAHRAAALRKQTMEVLGIAFLSSTVLELFAAIGVAMVAVYVGFALLGELRFGAWAQPLTATEGIFLLLVAPEVFQPLRDLASAWHDKAEAEAAADDVQTLLDHPATALLGTGHPRPALSGPATLEFRDVVLARADTRVSIPDFRVAAGKTVALVGPSGAGKTSCLLAAAGLLPPQTGRILVAGHRLSEDTADPWRQRLAWVPQQVRFPDVILRDYLSPRGLDHDPWPALRAAAADDVVAALPGGMMARLGENGTGVSGGEARRLLLARALLAQADVLIADEPTADLDPDLVHRISQTLRDEAAKGAAVLVATHDPVVMAAMDRVVTLR